MVVATSLLSFIYINVNQPTCSVQDMQDFKGKKKDVNIQERHDPKTK